MSDQTSPPATNLRDTFAGLAMSTLLASMAHQTDQEKAAIAVQAYAMADAMLHAR